MTVAATAALPLTCSSPGGGTGRLSRGGRPDSDEARRRSRSASRSVAIETPHSRLSRRCQRRATLGARVRAFVRPYRRFEAALSDQCTCRAARASRSVRSGFRLFPPGGRGGQPGIFPDSGDSARAYAPRMRRRPLPRQASSASIVREIDTLLRGSPPPHPDRPSQAGSRRRPSSAGGRDQTKIWRSSPEARRYPLRPLPPDQIR
jgi:hypothetical protein